MRVRRVGGVVVAVALAVGLAGPAVGKKKGPTKRPVTFDELPGWRDDDHAAAWPALMRSCRAVGASTRAWRAACGRAVAFTKPTDAEARTFFETSFRPYRLLGADDAPTGLVTGYYEPMLDGSLRRTERFRYPIYADPGAERTYARVDIDGPRRPLAGHELAWVDDPIGLYFMHVEGSGKVRLPDGRVLAFDYDAQNGRKFAPVGKELIARGAIPRDAVTLDTIRDWLATHPAEVEDILHLDPSYVFFKARPSPEHGPLGALGIELTPERSIAVDPTYVPLGVPVWLATDHPLQPGLPYRRLVLAQDTGGAIRGPLRADLYWGEGRRAERNAGNMKERGAVYVLLPRDPDA